MLTEDINWCISTTNNVIDKWRSSKTPMHITKDDVNQILLGYFRKRLTPNRNKQEFRELKRRLIIHTDENLHIKNLLLNIHDLQKASYNTVVENKIILIEAGLQNINYTSLIGINDSKVDYNPLVNINAPNNIKNINFESIKNIKF